jgi:hypothetical protein
MTVAGRCSSSLAACVIAGLALAGCYKPNITDNGFLCAPTGKQCPDGFRCGSDGRCSINPAPPPPPPVDSGTETQVMTDASDARDAGEVAMCVPAAPLCQDAPAGSDACSPSCQTGCDCGQRCNVVNGSPSCVSIGTVKLGDVCNPNKDNCGAGLICLLEPCGNGLGRCYRHCTSADQCDGTACTIFIQNEAGINTTFKTCDVPARACDPVIGTGCADPALNCYLTNANRTLCDCPGNPTKPGMNNDPCLVYSDCAEGFICISGVNGQTSAHCHFVCEVGKAGSCPGSEPNCNPTVVGAKYGYCSM